MGRFSRAQSRSGRHRCSCRFLSFSTSAHGYSLAPSRRITAFSFMVISNSSGIHMRLPDAGVSITARASGRVARGDRFLLPRS
jgi:hypothetical protein